MSARGLLALASVLLACNPQKSQWGLEAISTMQTPPDPAAGCGVVLPADTLTGERDRCRFGPGETAETSLGITPALALQLPIRHVVVMIQENRSYDHIFGKLHDQGQSESEALPADFTNPDLKGVAVPFAHASTTCIAPDPRHQYSSITSAVNGGAMDGFVKNAARTTHTDGHYVMAYYEQADLPFSYFLANTFAVSDRHFAPAQSGTFCNRNFLLFGTNAGAVDTGLVYPEPNTPSLLQLLMNAGYTWGAYSDGEPFEGSLGWSPTDPGSHSVEAFYAALAAGTLPNVSFLDAGHLTDDHPTADLQAGEAWLKQIYEAARASPQWNSLAFVWTFDEAGGFPDHVAPPAACEAVTGSPFLQRGPRVPLVMVSPWAKRHYVSHRQTDHTAITRFIETLFGLGALTRRDANSDDLLDLFDFSCGRELGVPEAPAAGSGGCARLE